VAGAIAKLAPGPRCVFPAQARLVPAADSPADRAGRSAAGRAPGRAAAARPSCSGPRRCRSGRWRAAAAAAAASTTAARSCARRRPRARSGHPGAPGAPQRSSTDSPARGHSTGLAQPRTRSHAGGSARQPPRVCAGGRDCLLREEACRYIYRPAERFVESPAYCAMAHPAFCSRESVNTPGVMVSVLPVSLRALCATGGESRDCQGIRWTGALTRRCRCSHESAFGKFGWRIA